ncbi:MAG: (2Fe-2S)-binding protein [Bacteroidaceae bacterium]|nr:(2Fe-2S)-binding protein [Bacteroidaceae bacterium]
MKITVNGKEIETSGSRPLIEVLRGIGIDIPSMCYAQGAAHEASCMVCMVKDVGAGRMIPSCATYPTEGMCIEIDTEEVNDMRRMALELLLSDHRADCVAPCTMVCPNGLDVAQVIFYYDRGQHGKALALLKAAGWTSANNLCEGCKHQCEKACRRRTVDESVKISEIIASVLSSQKEEDTEGNVVGTTRSGDVNEASPSRLGRYTDDEKDWLKGVYNQPSHCLHCSCEGREGCKLRRYAHEAGIRGSRYVVSSSLPVKLCQKVSGKLRFEPAKCIRCGLCVYNTDDGFTFYRRGFDMQVIIPEESKHNVKDEISKLCPTGALYIEQS